MAKATSDFIDADSGRPLTSSKLSTEAATLCRRAKELYENADRRVLSDDEWREFDECVARQEKIIEELARRGMTNIPTRSAWEKQQ
jgi:hypothetical protein